MDLDSVDSDSTDSGSDYAPSGGTLALLPLSIAGIVAFLEKATALAAIESLFGAGLFATALTEALFVVGAITTGFIGAIAFVVAVAWLVALVKRSALGAIVAVVGTAYFAISGAIGYYVFSGLPLLVGFVLASNIVLYGAIIIVVALVGAGALAVLG